MYYPIEMVKNELYIIPHFTKEKNEEKEQWVVLKVFH